MLEQATAGFAVVEDAADAQLFADELQRGPQHGFGPDAGVAVERICAVSLGGTQRDAMAAVGHCVVGAAAGTQLVLHPLGQPADLAYPVRLNLFNQRAVACPVEVDACPGEGVAVAGGWVIVVVEEGRGAAEPRVALVVRVREVELQHEVVAAARGLPVAPAVAAGAAPGVEREHEILLLRVVVVRGEKVLVDGLMAQCGERGFDARLLQQWRVGRLFQRGNIERIAPPVVAREMAQQADAVAVAVVGVDGAASLEARKNFVNGVVVHVGFPM